MQLSFPSAPADPVGLSPGATPSACGSSPSDPSSGSGAVGFAQLLAGVAPAVSGPQGAAPVATTGVAPGFPANAAPLNGATVPSGTPGEPVPSPIMPGTGVDLSTIVGRIVTTGATLVPQPGLGRPAPQKTSPGTEKKSLAETGDLQALAVIAGQLPTPVAAPVGAPLQTAASAGDKAAVTLDAGANGVIDLSAGNRGSGRNGMTALEAMMARSAGVSGNGAEKNTTPFPAANPAATNAPFEMTAKPAPTLTAANAVTATTDKAAAIAPKLAIAGAPVTPSVGSLTNASANQTELAQTQTPPDQTTSTGAAVLPDLGTHSDMGSAQQPPPEKFAAIAASSSAALQPPVDGATKSALATKGKSVTQSEPTFGIAVAKHDPTMPAGSTFDRSTVSDTAPVAAPSAAAEARSATAEIPQPVVLTSSAHRAVEAVLDATDRFAARDQHSVNLQFSVGGSDLNVRVELRSGEVHTTFRTDSPDLRAALSSEWNSMTSQQNGDRSTRLATPVFTTTDQSGTATSFSGDGASRQRDPQSRASEPQTFGLPGARRDSSTTAASSSTSNLPMTRSVAVNSVHLHTLA